MGKIIILMITLFSLSFSGCEEKNIGKGVIAGEINIGPICPVETDPPDPGCMPTAETYRSYPVYIQSASGSQNILINPALDGSFNIELEPGVYVLTLGKTLTGLENSNLPLSFRVNQSEKTVVSVEIDTGIR